MANARVMRGWLWAALYGCHEETNRNHDESHDRRVHEDIRIGEHRGLHPEHLVYSTDSIIADRASGSPHCSQRLFVGCDQRFKKLIEGVYPL